jgi:hypothetical protein
MSIFSNNNFNIQHQYRDFWSDVQRNMNRIGDTGKESDEFKERAYKQFQNTEYHDLAKIQDEFIPEDPLYGTPCRPNNRNYNRMEYDQPERHDNKDNDSIKKEVNSKVEMNVKDILNAFQTQGWTLNNTATAIGIEPIIKTDYDKQMTTDK